MNDIYSFYQLISKYQIEIPIIQRDYAQGRNNPKAADVRKSLVGNMIKAVKEDKSLFFDFVYGRVDNNKFIPFDGQQRLTTLFLFHKYVFEKCQSDSGCNHKDNCSCRSILGRFSYATRQSSQEFCEKLVENNIIPDDKYKTQLRETFIAELKKEVNEKEKKADEFIKSIDNWIYRFVTNQPWFYPDWEKDPTIMGMLTMLDEIHCQIRNETDFKTFAEKLTSGCNCPITFHFVDMGEHKMSDETYVKMNARGKTLTPFENFKASLEQFLEDKKLQNRLKNKIDGDWLDLFWKINGNVLPDTLMMSFFNRHFMNVWRSWYANNSKSEKKEGYDTFNTRIQKEMPLYPTKDNFVSFEIYSYVLDNCGVDECLTPIFNIWDTLYDKSKENDNSILNDCQAVWNRKDEGPKWNLYQGDKNKDNRETYPSRVAFYALMKYFKNSTDTASLTQWMRVVWNIIENSTIDSFETYHAALRLIEKLSAKSHTIYNALANEFESFELGNQYHAQEQVAEEIAKAKQILRPDGKTWENIIIKAEKYEFFKGAIRFLFTKEDIGDDWEHFDTKWENAQKYFDNNGVKEMYQTNACLLRYYISKFNEWWMFWDFPYDNKPTTWKSLLTSNRFIANHSILMQTPENLALSNFNAHLDKYDDSYKDLQNNVQNDLVKTTILVEASKWSSKLNWHNNTYCLYPYKAKADWKKYVIGNYRNHILSRLCDSKQIVVEGNRRFQSGDSEDFFWGWDINFKYNSYDFQWNTDGNVYLIENNDRKKDENGLDYLFSWDGINDANKFEDELDSLIKKVQQNGNLQSTHEQ